MKIGTKSVLYGAHCFLIHPFYVAKAWRKLYGFPWDPRLWFAFFLHDIGYWGKPNMDGEEGERHPEVGAKIMGILFGAWWHDFTLLHSRFLAKKLGKQYSRLCVADKLALTLTPAWLYLPMVRWTGEIKEYMKDADMNTGGTVITNANYQYDAEWHIRQEEKLWKQRVDAYVFAWVQIHKDGAVDTWTSANRTATNESGVWK